ncbi:hypothetical protein KEM48_006057 [Puccinia striiformis f. sp. tritici PST-130]|nr:hypothetical protein KEM48_006057 [Puccinia striiformis f. sp. tritici PST-130]
MALANDNQIIRIGRAGSYECPRINDCSQFEGSSNSHPPFDSPVRTRVSALFILLRDMKSRMHMMMLLVAVIIPGFISSPAWSCFGWSHQAKAPKICPKCEEATKRINVDKRCAIARVVGGSMDTSTLSLAVRESGALPPNATMSPVTGVALSIG